MWDPGGAVSLLVGSVSLLVGSRGKAPGRRAKPWSLLYQINSFQEVLKLEQIFQKKLK